MADGTTRVRVKISGDKQVREMLHGIGLDIDDLHPAMQDVGKYLKGFYGGEVFASRGQVIGEPWRRLSEPYASRKAKRYRKGVLVATGAMQKAFTYSTTNTSATITNKDRKFEWHQAGTNTIPARVMMKLEDGDAQYNKLVAIIEASLASSIKKRGGV
ncbi:phage virion morphogenesis protein [Rhodococcus sp. NPDC004095]